MVWRWFSESNVLRQAQHERSVILFLLFFFLASCAPTPHRAPSPPPAKVPVEPVLSKAEGPALSKAEGKEAAAPAPRAYVTNFMSNSVSVIDTREHFALEHVRVGIMPRGVAVSPDGREVYVANQLSDTISVIRTSDNRVVVTIPVDEGPYGVAVTPDGREIYVTHAGHFPKFEETVSVISTQERKVVGKIEVQQQPMGAVVSPDGRLLYVVNMWGKFQWVDPSTDTIVTDSKAPSTLSVIDTGTKQVIATVDLKQQMAAGVAVSPDGKEVYVTHQFGEQGVVSVVRARDLELIKAVSVGNGPFGVAVSPDGKRLYVANLGTAYGDETVSVISLPEHEVIATVKVGKVPVGLSVTPDGKEVYVANRRSNTVSVIDTTTLEVKFTVGVEDQPWGFGQFIAVVPAG